MTRESDGGTVDVAIVGGGPTGLMLASELRLSGGRPVVLERLYEINGQPKSNGLIGRIIDVLDYRGLLERFVDAATFAGPRPIFEYSGLRLDLRRLGENPMRRISIPQLRIEQVLNERALELGVEIRRGHEVSSLAQDADGVTLEISGPDGGYRLRARYVVGADGGRSLVRKQTGIGFPGTTNRTMITHLGDVAIPESHVDPETEELVLPDLGRVNVGLSRNPNGVFAHVIRGGVHRVATMEWQSAESVADDDGPITLAELGAAVHRVLGVDLPMSEPVWLTRVVDNSRQADRYRAGRVLLVGDAAHVHSALGGPGLNLGLQDAVNLGWKLAAEVAGWAGPDLLDSYQAERHPVGRRVLMYTVAQTALLTPGDEMTQIRALLADLLEEPEALRRFIAMFAGTDVRYQFDHDGVSPSPLVGRWAPDLPLVTARGETRVAELMHAGRPVLLDLADSGLVAGAATDWTDRVDLVAARIGSATRSAPEAVLIRPDGYVAWAAQRGETDMQVRDGLRGALAAWFGSPG